MAELTLLRWQTLKPFVFILLILALAWSWFFWHFRLDLSPNHASEREMMLLGQLDELSAAYQKAVLGQRESRNAWLAISNEKEQLRRQLNSQQKEPDLEKQQREVAKDRIAELENLLSKAHGQQQLLASKVENLNHQLAEAIENIEGEKSKRQRLASENTGSEVLTESLSHELATRGPLEWANSTSGISLGWESRDEQGRSPWLRALAKGNLVMAQWLYGQMRKHDHRDIEGNGSMHCAVAGGVPVLEFLFAQHFDADGLNLKGQSPLHLAAELGSLDVVKLLIAHGASTELTDVQGRMPLHLAALAGHVKVVQLLMDSVVDAQQQDNLGLTPFHLAVRGGFLDVAQVLLKDYGELNRADLYGCVPLHAAVRSGDTSMVKWLMDQGAMLMAADQDGRTAMHHAVMTGKTEMVKVLIRNGMPVLSFDVLGRSPLHLAVVYGHLDMVRVLISAGADPLVVDALGRSPRDWAKKLQRDSMYEMLGVEP